MKMRTLLFTVMATSTLLLSGCWINETLQTGANNSGSNAGGGVITSPTTVSSLAVSQITTATTGTCDQRSPQEINSVTFIAPDDAQTDVTNLNPGCKN